MTKRTITDLYRFLSMASMARLKDDEKVAVIRLLRSMKPVVKEVQDAARDALQKAQAECPDDQQRAIQLADLSLADLLAEEVNIDTRILSADAFERLTLSNDWTFAQIDELEGYTTLNDER